MEKENLPKNQGSSKFDPIFSLNLTSYYDEPTRFFQSLYEFSGAVNSLHRYFEYTQKYINEYLIDSVEHLEKNRHTDLAPAEFYDFYGDMHMYDQEYFVKHHLGGVLSSLFILLEKLLDDIAKEVAKELGIQIELPAKEMPYINKYIYFLKNGCEIDISIDKETNKKLDWIRHIRNKYIHELGNNISKDVGRELNKLLDNANQEDFEITKEFIELSFQIITDIARILEKNYISFWDKRHGNG